MIDPSVLIPGFHEPALPTVNPAAGAAEDEAVDWLWRIGFLTNQAQERHLRSFEFGLYHGIATPHVDLDHLVTGLMWFCWGSLADDQYDNYDWGDREPRTRLAFRELHTILAGQRPDPATLTPVGRGLCDLWPRLTAGRTERARQRTSGHFLDYLQAVVFQNRFHASGEIPDSATFLTLRRNTIAMLFQADVLEVVSQSPVADELRDSLPFRELVTCFADITAWHNDVYGLEKDLADGQTCNAVQVVAASERCDLDQAVERVLDRACQRQRMFLSLQRQLPDVADQLGLGPLAAYRADRLAHDLRAYVYANLVWIQHTRRYDLDLPRISGTFGDLLGGQPQPPGAQP